MLNFGASKPRIKGGGRAPGPPGSAPGCWNLYHIHFEINYLFRFESEKCRILEFSLNGTEIQ